jgi:hypothetical protein
MRAAGFSRLNLALVSSDVAILETSKRPHTIEKYKEVVLAARRLGFQITSYQILGLPYESIESMLGTLSLAARLPVLLGASMFYRTPASPIASIYASEGGDSHFLARMTAIANESKFFSTPFGFEPISQFKYDLFDRARRETGFVTSLTGEIVNFDRASFGRANSGETVWI